MRGSALLKGCYQFQIALNITQYFKLTMLYYLPSTQDLFGDIPELKYTMCSVTSQLFYCELIYAQKVIQIF